MALGSLSACLLRWRRLALRRFYMNQASFSAGDLPAPTSTSPILAMRRERLEARVLEISQEESRLLQHAVASASRATPPLLLLQRHVQVWVERWGKSACLAPMLRPSPTCQHRRPDQTKHGASQGVSWTKCQDCGAVLVRAQIVLAFWDSYATMCVVHNG